MYGARLRELAAKYAIKNAMDYGKPSLQAVLSKVIAEMPEAKNDMRYAVKAIGEEIEKVAAMSGEKLKSAYSEYTEEFDEHAADGARKSAGHRMVLDGAVNGAFATRFSPEPSVYMHIGHAKAAFLEQEFARIYSGRLMLYFDDTNPEKESAEYVAAFKADLGWLGMRFDAEYYASDSIKILYDYAATMIDEGNAYVCTCKTEEIKEGRSSGAGCIHREKGRDENAAAWQDMLNGKFDKNCAILRLKGSMESQNTAMRDPTLFRIKSARHYKQGTKYRVWPTYDFNTPVMDSVKGITDVIRSKEYELRDELYGAILGLLKLRAPRVHSISRLEIRGNITSKRPLNALVDAGEVSGYADPRLVTIAGLRRRGIVPAAIREFALSFGMSKAESVSDMDRLLRINRSEIEKAAKRLFAVERPVKLSVDGTEGMMAELMLHPEASIGDRAYKVGREFYISGDDADGLNEGDTVHLKGLCSIVIIGRGDDGSLFSKRIEEAAQKKIQWVSSAYMRECTLVHIGELLIGDEVNLESAREEKAYCEAYAENLNEGEIVQFERVGFFKLDIKRGFTFLSL